MTATLERELVSHEGPDPRVEEILEQFAAGHIDLGEAIARFNEIDESVVPGEEDLEIVLPDAHHSLERRNFYRKLKQIVKTRKALAKSVLRSEA